MHWEISKNLVVGKTKTLEANEKIACFDMDDTIIVKWNRKDDDFEFQDETILDKLTKLVEDNYKIVIVSNQLHLKKVSKLQKLVEVIQIAFNFDLVYIAALCEDKYRKPNVATWTEYIRGDTKTSFYCGDAGGIAKARTINGIKIKKDFSDSDLKFAKNIGIRFLHRDEFVYNKKYSGEDYKINYIDFSLIPKKNYTLYEPTNKELIIVVGLPASGKSFYSNLLKQKGCEIINRDTLKTPKKCFSVAEKAISENKIVVIDNTNLKKITRQSYIELAKKNNYTCVCIVFPPSFELCMHNNYYRNTYCDKPLIPKIVYYKMKKEYEEPTVNEGFSKILKIEYQIAENVDKNYFKYFPE